MEENFSFLEIILLGIIKFIIALVYIGGIIGLIILFCILIYGHIIEPFIDLFRKKKKKPDYHIDIYIETDHKKDYYD